MHKSRKYIRKILAAAIGLPIVVVGIILIPLPGPGVVITFIGLFILAQEFDQAEKFLESAKARVKKVVQKSLDAYRERIEKIDKM
jgi:uncharacterized protein (TIGR02611 family)